MSKLRAAIPILRWAPSYRRADLGPDVVAGLTTAVMLVPQAMAYAMLAGLPPEVGLYASLLPILVYAAFGSSRHLAVGPVAMVSILVASAVGSVAAAGTSEYLGYALLIALLVGVTQLLMGVLRLGFVVNLLSHPVLSGFTSAAALIIGFSQLKHLLGVDIPRSHFVHEVIGDAASQLDAVNGATLAIGLASIALLVGLKRWAPRFPRALLVVVLATVATATLGLADVGVAIVGDIPAGLPPLSMPPLSADILAELAPTAIVIALIAFMESISVAKVFARRHRYDVDANQELIGLGLANVAAAFTSGYAVTGGFSRTAVNDQAGARTPVAAIVTAALVGLTALLLTPLFFYLPKAVLAAIIMTAVFGLIDVAEVRHLWRVKRSDLVFLVITFVGTLLLGIEAGIGVGVATSVLWLLYCTTRPHTAILGRLPGTEIYRNLRHYPDAVRTPGVAVLRIDARLYFGNVEHLKRTCRELCADAPVRVLVLDAAPVNDIDASGESALEDLRQDLEIMDIGLRLAHVKGPVREVLARSGFRDRLGADRFHDGLHDAVQAAAAEAASPTTPESPASAAA